MAVNFIIKQITQKWYLNKMSHQKFMPTVDNIKLFPFPQSAAELVLFVSDFESGSGIRRVPTL